MGRALGLPSVTGGLVDTALYAVLAATYMNSWLGQSALVRWLLSVLVIVIFAALNIRSLRSMALSSAAFAVVILVPCAAMTLLGFAAWQANPLDPFVPAGQGLGTSLGLGLTIAIWFYSGYESMSTMAGEVAEPQRVIPRALFLSIPFVVGVYLLPTLAGLASVGRREEWSSATGIMLVEVARALGGPVLGALMMVAALVSSLALYNAYLASCARTTLVMAQDRLLPRAFARGLGGAPLARAVPASHIESVGLLLAAWAAQSAASGMLDQPTALLREHAERGVARDGQRGPTRLRRWADRCSGASTPEGPAATGRRTCSLEERMPPGSKGPGAAEAAPGLAFRPRRRIPCPTRVHVGHAHGLTPPRPKDEPMRSTGALLILALVVGCAPASERGEAAGQAGGQSASGTFTAGEPLDLTANTRVYGSFHFAESCSYDPVRDLYVAPSVGNRGDEFENDGYVSLINPDGTVHTLKWIGVTRGGLTLNDPLGSDIVNGRFYVVDRNVVRWFDLTTGEPLGSSEVSGATSFNDLEVAEDGTAYMSQTGATDGSVPQRIYRLLPDGTSSVFVDGDPLSRPNGVAFDPDGNIVVVNVESADIHTFSPEGELLGTRQSLDAGNDGLVILDDGTMYVSSVRQGTVARIPPGGEPELVASGIQSAASMCYDATRQRLIVPMNSWFALAFVDLGM